MIRAATLHALGLALACSGLSGCIIVSTRDSDQQRYSETRTMRLPVASGSAVDVEGRNGSIEINAAEGAEAVVIATISARSQARVDNAALRAETVGERLTVRVDWPDGGARSGDAVSFQIRTPAPRGVRALTTNGRVTLRDTAGEAEIDTTNAGVRVSQHAGDLIAETSNGSIDARDVGGSVEATTTNGSVDLNNIAGRAIATSSNGPISVQLAPTSPGPVRVRSSNGPIDLTLGSAFVGELRLSTSNGRIRVTGAGTDESSSGVRVVRVGEGGAASEAATSNASITVTVATPVPAGSGQ